MADAVHRLGFTVSAAAAFGSLVAVASHADNKVKVYTWPGMELLQQLEGHEATVSGLAFAETAAAADGDPPMLRLVSSSHDRNAFVWTQQQATAAAAATTWKPELVITKLRKAAMCVAWAPGGGAATARKFAFGAVDAVAGVCYLDADRELWAPRLIQKRHDSAVMALAWHPSGAALATVSADGKLRVFNAVVPGVCVWRGGGGGWALPLQDQPPKPSSSLLRVKNYSHPSFSANTPLGSCRRRRAARSAAAGGAGQQPLWRVSAGGRAAGGGVGARGGLLAMWRLPGSI